LKKKQNCRRKCKCQTRAINKDPAQVKLQLVMSHPLLPCASFKICIQPQSGEFAAPADQTVLQSALESGYALPSSCRNGVCRTCLCRLHSGRISYRMDWPGLSAEEKADGLFLPCVAYPASDLLMQIAAPG